MHQIVAKNTGRIIRIARTITKASCPMQVLHDKLLDKVLSLPMSFFDTQPSGRLIARFTHDVETTDIDLQDTIDSFIMCFSAVIVAIVVVAVVTKGAVLVALAPLIPVYLSVQSYYLATSRELNRLNSVALSPIFSNFSETLAGLITVRAFRKQVCKNPTFTSTLNWCL